MLFFVIFYNLIRSSLEFLFIWRRHHCHKRGADFDVRHSWTLNSECSSACYLILWHRKSDSKGFPHRVVAFKLVAELQLSVLRIQSEPYCPKLNHGQNVWSRTIFGRCWIKRCCPCILFFKIPNHWLVFYSQWSCNNMKNVLTLDTNTLCHTLKLCLLNTFGAPATTEFEGSNIF